MKPYGWIIIGFAVAVAGFVSFHGIEKQAIQNKMRYAKSGDYVLYTDGTICRLLSREPVSMHCPSVEGPAPIRTIEWVYDRRAAAEDEIPKRFVDQFTREQ